MRASVSSTWAKGHRGCRACGRPCGGRISHPASGRVLLVGNPNVGKSAVFNALTGGRATVSNYPGTTVEASEGLLKGTRGSVRVADLPGMYSLVALTEEERVAAREALAAGDNTVIVQVGDAKNVERTLALTLQLLDLRVPMVLVLNMLDEAEAAGIHVQADVLSASLGIPVVGTSAITARGIDSLHSVITATLAAPPCRASGCGSQTHRPSGSSESASVTDHDLRQVTTMLEALGRVFEAGAPGRGRLYGSMYLEGGRDVLAGLVPGAVLASADGIARGIDPEQAERIALAAAGERHARARSVARGAHVREQRDGALPSAAVHGVDRLDRLLIHPILGFVPLAIVLYLGLYVVVGKIGAGVIVDFIDTGLFERFVTPWAAAATAGLPGLARDLLAGEYGLITVALRYALAVIMPIVGTFFLAFALLEDSGYLPRMALMLDRWLRRLGLNGRAVVPIVLGLGCDTMATVVTRTLETRRERLIATIILALAIPCSAQLGLIMAILSPRPAAFGLWALVVFGALVAVGTAAARFLPGSPPGFFMELPPMRVPQAKNVASKSWTRMTWYVLEVIPVFACMSAGLTLADRYGALARVAAAVRPLMRLMGLPAPASEVFIYGFFRRDYGAAGLYDLASAGLLTTNQMLVAAVVLTLFVPCVAQFTVMVRERGLAATVGISTFVVACAAMTGVALNAALLAVGVVL